MTNLEKYLKLKKEYKGCADSQLTQYLTIVQMLNQEKESFEEHKRNVRMWLRDIEKSMKEIKASEMGKETNNIH
ncbi:MAG: hypothetical protein IJ449_00035 [Clostridia bacterium]|nr:hypothetical protein [Clostridia bacterium]